MLTKADFEAHLLVLKGDANEAVTSVGNPVKITGTSIEIDDTEGTKRRVEVLFEEVSLYSTDCRHCAPAHTSPRDPCRTWTKNDGTRPKTSPRVRSGAR